MVTLPVQRRATLADLAAARNEGRAVELVDGELVEKALPRPAHGAAQIMLGIALGPFTGRAGGPRGPGGWWLMSEVEVLYAEVGDAYRHDLVGFRRDRHPSRPADLPVTTRPDWVCEILSPSTARIDQGVKKRVLHRHGVPHYWIIDPEHETLSVLRHGPDGFIAVLDAGVGDVVTPEPFDAVPLDVSELFGRDAGK